MTSTRNYMRVRDKRVKEAKARYHRLKYKTSRPPKFITKMAHALGITPNQARAVLGLPYRLRRRIVDGKRQTKKAAIYEIESVAARHRPMLPSRRQSAGEAAKCPTHTAPA